jgi:hypothetical protein
LTIIPPRDSFKKNKPIAEKVNMAHPETENTTGQDNNDGDVFTLAADGSGCLIKVDQSAPLLDRVIATGLFQLATKGLQSSVSPRKEYRAIEITF